MQPNPVDTFLQEADELLAEIEGAALSMSGDRAGSEAVNQIFRAFHTIKGSGAMFGFDGVAAFTHHVETLLDQVREGSVPVSEQLSNVILAATDQIKLLLQAAQGGAAVDVVSQAALLERVRGLSATVAAPVTRVDAPVSAAAGAGEKDWHIHFRPDAGMLSRGGNPLLLFRDLKKLGECVIRGHVDGLPALAEMETSVCYLWWTITLTTAADLNDIRDVFLFVEDGSELRIEPAEDSPEILPVVTAGPVSASPALAVEPEARTSGAQAQPREATVRVPATRLDRLVTLVGAAGGGIAR